MDEKQLSPEDLQKILDENAQIIQIIMKSQSEGRMMDSLLYQARLQLNLVQLASVADNRPHPSIGLKNENIILTKKSKSDKKALVSIFIQAIKENGMKDLDFISKLTSISLQDVLDLSMNFIDFLKRQNRYSEAVKFEEELEIYHRKKIEEATKVENNLQQDENQITVSINLKEANQEENQNSNPSS